MVAPKVAELEKKLADLDSKLESRREQGRAGRAPTPTPGEVFGSPFARKGESSLTSRGFQFQRLFGFMSGVIEPEHAKVEIDMAERLRKKMVSEYAYNITGSDRYVSQGTKSFLAPLGADMLMGTKESPMPEEFKREIKSLSVAGVDKLDQDEMEWVMKKVYRGNGKTAQSWIDETLGGALVGPAGFGELIQLLRNKDALINAGARVEALPPSGRLRLPRQTTPTTGYYIGENSGITSSNYGTGHLELSAKKVAALVTLPNELIRFASPASEAILRSDMTKTLSLTMDYYLLYGEGSDNVPLGLVNTPNISTIVPAGTGGALAPQDLYQFISAIEANNGEFQGWILRPELFYQFVMARAAVYAGVVGDTLPQGQFVFDQMRQLGQGAPKTLGGFPATTTSQVSITRGDGSETTLFGGQWDDYIIAMFGSIEFAQATQGDTAFANDQTVVRGILSHDGAARHPGVFAVADGIPLTIGS